MRISAVHRRLSRAVLAAAAVATVATACGPTTTPAVAGNPTDYAVNIYQGIVERWNPCAPVHYRVDDHLVPSALANVKVAVAALSKATGITFTYDGLASYVPQPNGWNQPAPLVISFSRHTGQTGGSSLLAGGNQLGEGGFQSSYSTVDGKITSLKIIKGYVVLDAAGYTSSTAKVKTSALLHELGHAVGLNHAHFASEIMYPVVSSNGAGAYSSGDLAGLAKLGRPAGCLS